MKLFPRATKKNRLNAPTLILDFDFLNKVQGRMGYCKNEIEHILLAAEKALAQMEREKRKK